MNKVELEGVVVTNPELRKDRNGKPWTRFTLRVEETTYDEDGSERYNIDFPTVTVFGDYAKELTKGKISGTKLYVNGKISTRRDKDEDGRWVNHWSVIADNVEPQN